MGGGRAEDGTGSVHACHGVILVFVYNEYDGESVPGVVVCFKFDTVSSYNYTFFSSPKDLFADFYAGMR